MAKRLTETDKWKDDWFISLSNDDKIIWQWLVDNCNHAGLCKRSIGLLNLLCRVDYTEDQVLEKMNDRVIIHENFWFIPKFLKFQYTDLQSNRPVIVSVRRELIKTGAYRLMPADFGNDYLIIPESLNNDYLIIKDKSKDKDKDKGKNKSEDAAEKNEPLAETGLCQQMLKVFKDVNPAYQHDESDLRELLQIGYKIAAMKNFTKSSITAENQNATVNEWGELLLRVRGDPFYSTKDIAYLNKDWKSLTLKFRPIGKQKIKNSHIV